MTMLKVQTMKLVRYLIPAMLLAGVATAEPLRIVASVYDGDTISMRNGDKVRITQLDTPEIKGVCPREKELAIEARDMVRSMVNPGNAPGVRLHIDPTLGNRHTDKYGRLLRRVETADGRDVAAVLKATRSTRYPDTTLGRHYDGRTRRQPWC